MAALTKEEQELLEKLRKKSAGVVKGPAPGQGRPAGDKFGGFPVGVDDEGRPFPPAPPRPGEKPKK